jgi:hypothetical protein
METKQIKKIITDNCKASIFRFYNNKLVNGRSYKAILIGEPLNKETAKVIGDTLESKGAINIEISKDEVTFKIK